MDQPFISRACIQQMGYDAAKRGDSRDSLKMKLNAPARPDWMRGYDLAKTESQTAPVGRARIELAQGEAA